MVNLERETSSRAVRQIVLGFLNVDTEKRTLNVFSVSLVKNGRRVRHRD